MSCNCLRNRRFLILFSILIFIVSEISVAGILYLIRYRDISYLPFDLLTSFLIALPISVLAPVIFFFTVDCCYYDSSF